MKPIITDDHINDIEKELLPDGASGLAPYKSDNLLDGLRIVELK